MITLVKEYRFEAAHRLPHHDGKCQRTGEYIRWTKKEDDI